MSRFRFRYRETSTLHGLLKYLLFLLFEWKISGLRQKATQNQHMKASKIIMSSVLRTAMTISKSYMARFRSRE